MTLSFRLGSIPVRVHPWLVVMGVLLGLGAQRGLLGVSARAGAFVFAIFAHELGHAIVGRSFGVPAEVDLTLFRNAVGARIASLSPVRRIVVCLAGPAANLCAAAIVFAIFRAHPQARELGAGALGYLGWVNLGWGLLNLVPILPLDTGHALVAALDRPTKGCGELAVRCISIAPAVALACVAMVARMPFPALICSLLAFQNARGLAVARQRRNREQIVRVHLRAAFAALERGEPALAIGHCRTIVGASADPAICRDAVRLLAYAYATSNQWTNLMELLESGGVRALEEGELEKYQQAARELGRSEEAQRIAFLRSRSCLAG